MRISLLTESRDIAAASVIVTQHLHERGYCNRLHQDVSLLAGMVCRIGVAPILKIADEFDDSFANPTFLNQTITHFDQLGRQRFRALALRAQPYKSAVFFQPWAV